MTAPQDGPLESYHAHGDQLGLSCLFRWFHLVHHELLPDVVEICALLQNKSRWWFQFFFHFHPYLGKIPILTNIFQMG